MTQQEFIVSLEEKGIVLSEKQIEQFEKYYEILVEWNEKMNLTAITDREGVYLKHFYDSLTIAFDFLRGVMTFPSLFCAYEQPYAYENYHAEHEFVVELLVYMTYQAHGEKVSHHHRQSYHYAVHERLPVEVSQRVIGVRPHDVHGCCRHSFGGNERHGRKV